LMENRRWSVAPWERPPRAAFTMQSRIGSRVAAERVATYWNDRRDAWEKTERKPTRKPTRKLRSWVPYPRRSP